MHRIEIDRAHHLLLIRIEAGGAADAEIEDFRRELRAAAIAARAEGDFFDILADLRGANLLPSGQTDAIAASMSEMSELGLRKAANLVDTMLMKLQLARLAPGDQNRFFTEEAEARSWLAG